ncbi:hypothetical protein GCK72_015229 [Caenorhabditis remanei]|uniref:Uncharacterized protein n=1 Tax=Caenorhabditis remanei TaxID=31234 RepID=A0A6A5GW40_CAERE|nr:hypothetical protein GCK72_015229 [Caenorhabditis remanei]KAF1758769.1 hypothetical protein GCK72_015229 [Caenorhabditis remanei]
MDSEDNPFSSASRRPPIRTIIKETIILAKLLPNRIEYTDLTRRRNNGVSFRSKIILNHVYNTMTYYSHIPRLTGDNFDFLVRYLGEESSKVKKYLDNKRNRSSLNSRNLQDPNLVKSRNSREGISIIVSRAIKMFSGSDYRRLFNYIHHHIQEYGGFINTDDALKLSEHTRKSRKKISSYFSRVRNLLSTKSQSTSSGSIVQVESNEDSDIDLAPVASACVKKNRKKNSQKKAKHYITTLVQYSPKEVYTEQ